MKITKQQLKEMVKGAVKAKLQEMSSLNKEAGSTGKVVGLAKEVDDFLMKMAEEAKKLVEKIEDEMRVDMLGGENPAAAPKIQERNRMLAARAGVLKKMAAGCVAAFELLRRE